MARAGRASAALEVVGTPRNRVEGADKVTGAAKYAGDLDIPGTLEARVLRSTHAHARVRSIDVSAARRVPGVAAVLSRDDLRGMDPYYGHCLRDRPIVAMERVRHVGEPVAAVAAHNALAAEEAVSRIAVEYEELPCVTSLDEALGDGAPVLHERVAGSGDFHDVNLSDARERPNICHHEHIELGDVERGFAQSHEIFEDVFEFPMVCHYSMEPHTTTALVQGRQVTLWSASAHPFLIRSELAKLFGLSMTDVQVVVPYVGGAFGGKSYLKIEPLVVALARKTPGQPVRLEHSVTESMLTARRHSARCRIKTGVKRDGAIMAREVTMHLDTGAYADNGPRVVARSVLRVHGAYRCANFRSNSYGVYTNSVPAGSMRSIGGPQSIWPVEAQMDRIAEALGLDPVEYRLRHLLGRDESIRPNSRGIDGDLREGLSRVAEMVRQAGTPPAGSGTGFAVGITDSEANPVSTAIVRLLSDGDVVVMAGSTEVGQGARTVLSQIVAEELCVPFERVNLRGTDTHTTPFDRSTGASRSTTVMGTAVKFAAGDVHRQVKAIAAEQFGVDPERVTLRGGAAWCGEARRDFPEVVAGYFGMPGGELIGRGYVRAGGGISPILPIFWEVGIGGAVVTVDRETGALTVERYSSVADVGRAINPRQAEGQDEGAAVMAMGHTLFESLVYADGQPLNPNLVDYRVPGFRDIPRTFESCLLENGDGPGPYGAKGMGEGGIIPVAPAICNALAQATGVRIHELPLTPERVWRALRKAGTESA